MVEHQNCSAAIEDGPDTPDEALDYLIVEAGWPDLHGGGHHDDDCPICRSISMLRAGLNHAYPATNARITDVAQAPLQLAVEQYFALWHRCGGSEAVSAEEFAKVRAAMRMALAAQPPAAPVMQDSIEAIISGIGAAETPAEQALEIVHKLGRAGYAIVKYGDVPAEADCDTVKHMWGQVEKARAEGTFSSLHQSCSAGSVRDYIANYRFEMDGGGSYCPSVREEAMLEDAIEGYIASLPKTSPSTGEPAAWVNGDELDNLLDDRTTLIQGTKSGWRKTPLYRAAPQPSPASAPLMTSGEIFTYLRERMKDQTSASLAAACRAFADHLRVRAAQPPTPSQTELLESASNAIGALLQWTSNWTVPFEGEDEWLGDKDLALRIRDQITSLLTRPQSQTGKVCGYHDGCPPDGPVCHLCAHLQPGASK